MILRERKTRRTFGKAPRGRLKLRRRRRAAGTASVAARRFACYDAVEFIDAGLRAGRGMTKSVVSFFKRSMYKTGRVDFRASSSACCGVLCPRWIEKAGHTTPLGLALRSARRALQTQHLNARTKIPPRFAAQRRAKRGGSFLIYRQRCIFRAAPALCATPRASRRLPPRRAARRGRTPRRRPARRGLSGGPRR